MNIASCGTHAARHPALYRFGADILVMPQPNGETMIGVWSGAFHLFDECRPTVFADVVERVLEIATTMQVLPLVRVTCNGVGEVMAQEFHELGLPVEYIFRSENNA
ncbi:MAG TPA: hypothetical protein VNL91_03825 [Thermoanaerobaculia bacterium]|nr:hypothetical protein [Thermoanaerobaculia bacterium]